MAGKYPLTKKEFENIYSKIPRLTVELILKTKEGVLLTKRAIEPYIGRWHIPGGTVYYKETLQDAVKRVAIDELGIRVKVKKFLGFIYYPNLIQDQGWDWPIGAAFDLAKTKGKYMINEQGGELKFFSEVPKNIVPSQGEFLKKHIL